MISRSSLILHMVRKRLAVQVMPRLCLDAQMQVLNSVKGRKGLHRLGVMPPILIGDCPETF